MLVLVVLLGGGLIGGAGWLVNHQINARVAAEQVALAERTRAEISEAAIARLETQLELERERQRMLQNDLQEARDREAKTTAVVEDRARLERLTQSKPTLLERMARRATTQVWSEIEAESRD